MISSSAVQAVADKNHYIASFEGFLGSLQPPERIVCKGDPNGKGLRLPEPMGSTNSLIFNSLRARVCPHNARGCMGAHIEQICHLKVHTTDVSLANSWLLHLSAKINRIQWFLNLNQAKQDGWQMRGMQYVGSSLSRVRTVSGFGRPIPITC
jgi:hypothetical protein